MERENQDLALEQIKLKAAEQHHMDTDRDTVCIETFTVDKRPRISQLGLTLHVLCLLLMQYMYCAITICKH